MRRPHFGHQTTEREKHERRRRRKEKLAFFSIFSQISSSAKTSPPPRKKNHLWYSKMRRSTLRNGDVFDELSFLVLFCLSFFFQAKGTTRKTNETRPFFLNCLYLKKKRSTASASTRLVSFVVLPVGNNEITVKTQ